MDLLKKISNLKKRDIIFTLDTVSKWSDFIKQLGDLDSKGKPFFYEIDSDLDYSDGMRCFIVFSNRVMCWLDVIEIEEISGRSFLKLGTFPNSPGIKYHIKNFKGCRYFVRGIREQ
jgi:hypothetical protein